MRRLPLGVSGVERGVGWSETKKSPCSLICEQNEKEEKKEEKDRGRGWKSISHRGPKGTPLQIYPR